MSRVLIRIRLVSLCHRLHSTLKKASANTRSRLAWPQIQRCKGRASNRQNEFLLAVSHSSPICLLSQWIADLNRLILLRNHPISFRRVSRRILGLAEQPRAGITFSIFSSIQSGSQQFTRHAHPERVVARLRRRSFNVYLGMLSLWELQRSGACSKTAGTPTPIQSQTSRAACGTRGVPILSSLFHSREPTTSRKVERLSRCGPRWKQIHRFAAATNRKASSIVLRLPFEPSELVSIFEN